MWAKVTHPRARLAGRWSPGPAPASKSGRTACSLPNTWATIPAGQGRGRKPGTTLVLNNNQGCRAANTPGSPREADEENL
jgi:hypothetical protein